MQQLFNRRTAFALSLIATLCFTSDVPAQEQSTTSSNQPTAQLQQQQPESNQGRREGRRRRQSSGRRSQRVRMREVKVASPDGNIVLTVLTNAERLSWTVTMGATTVIEPSAFQLNVDGYDLTSGVIFSNAAIYDIDDTYAWHGVHTQAVNHCNGVQIGLTHDLSMTPYTLELRAFNDGVAYRFIVPGESNATRVPEEYSKFRLPAGSTLWFHGMAGHYEGIYQKKDISAVQAGEWAAPPMTFKLSKNAGYGSITEANLANYAGMALEADGQRGWIVGLGHRQPLNYPYELRYGRDEGKRLGKPAAVTGTITTPWRVVMLGRDLNALVNSDILPNLCPPPDPDLFEGTNTDWLTPGFAVWDYTDRNYVTNAETNSLPRMKWFSELAGKIGARYHIVEGFAYRWSDDEIRDFTEYSKQQGVRALFWRHSRDLRTPEAREEFFSRLQRLGVAGAKIDFIDNEAKESVDLYEALLQKAAEHECVIDFHGANKPTGRMRTWPNDMIHEAVRGMEGSNLPDRSRHQTTLPFTRYLAGPTDYTTMHFGARRGDTSWAHQIASLATFNSTILTIAAHPQSILDNPAVNVITNLRPVWDETIVLPQSEIGELSAYARRAGTNWVLAVMCGPQAKTITVPLSFLDEGKYSATLVQDDKAKSDAVVVSDRVVTRKERLTIKMRNGGGFVGKFVRQ